MGGGSAFTQSYKIIQDLRIILASHVILFTYSASYLIIMCLSYSKYTDLLIT